MGIKDARHKHVNNSPSSPSTCDNKIIKTRNDALNDLIANLTNGSDKSHIDNNYSSSSACQVFTKLIFFFNWFLFSLFKIHVSFLRAGFFLTQ